MRTIFLLAFLFTCLALLASQKSRIDTLHNQAYAVLDSDPEKALNFAIRAEEIANTFGYEFEEANSLFIQAYLYREMNELGKAFVINLKALDILRLLDKEKAQTTYAKILVNTGEILKQHYAYSEAVQYYDEGLRVAQELNLTSTVNKLLYNKAVALRHHGSLELAMETIEEAIDLAQSENDDYKLIASINEKGLIQKDLELFDEARKTYWAIIDYSFERLNADKYIGRAWHNIGVTFKMESAYEKAINAFEKASEFHSKRPGSSDQFTSWLELSESYYLSGEFLKANEIALLANSIYKGLLLLPDHYALYDLLSKINYAQKDFESSHQHSQQFVMENDRFLKAQEEIIRVKDQYKMEVLTAGFFTEIQSVEAKERFRLYLIGCVLFFGIVFLTKHIRSLQIKKAITKEVQKLGKSLHSIFF